MHRRVTEINLKPKMQIMFFIFSLLFFFTEFMNLFSDYMDKYGTITKVYDGPQSTFLLVADENLFEYILSSPQLIEKASQYEYLQNWLGLGLLTSTGK